MLAPMSFHPARIIEVQRRTRRTYVIRAHCPDFAGTEAASPFTAGQYFSVTPELMPTLVRHYSAALPPTPEGLLEFHISIPEPCPPDSGTRQLLATVRVGDTWQISNPRGSLSLPDQPSFLVADGTGLAPLKALILARAEQSNPLPVHLLMAADSPGELYDLRFMAHLAHHLPFLTLTTAVEAYDDAPFTWPTLDCSSPQAPIPYLGTAAEVAARSTRFHDRTIVLSGGTEMLEETVSALQTAGVTSEILYDKITDAQSSPAMKRSRFARATSSGNCCGGDFIK